MRFRLTLASDRTRCGSTILPINYQYELSSWIYHTLHHGNPEFSAWLHDRGLVNRNKSFKFFTFSGLKPQRYRVNGDRFIIESDTTELLISFYLPDAVGHFITGLFRNQALVLGDRISSVGFSVRQVEKLPDIEFQNKMKFRALSPIIISHKENESQKHAQYLSPDDAGYETLFFNNLINKYIALANCRTPQLADGERVSDGLSGIPPKAGAVSLPNPPIDHHDQQCIDGYEVTAVDMNLEEAKRDGIEFRLTACSLARRKLIQIKSGKSNEVFLRGYLFDFELTAPAELIKIGYYGGFGEKNSLGFGCCEVISPKRPDRVRQDLSESLTTNPKRPDRVRQDLSESSVPYPKRPDRVR